MAKRNILGMLSFGGCSHQFSWPRRSAGGDYYQVCVLCGDEYLYDWDAMQRLGRKPLRSRTRGTIPTKAVDQWTPRARRMRLSGPVRYREAGTDAWIHGELKNISKSGLLFAGSGPLPEGSRIDIELEMPCEICGSIGRHVRCDAQIVRTRGGEKPILRRGSSAMNSSIARTSSGKRRDLSANLRSSLDVASDRGSELCKSEASPRRNSLTQYR